MQNIGLDSTDIEWSEEGQMSGGPSDEGQGSGGQEDGGRRLKGHPVSREPELEQKPEEVKTETHFGRQICFFLKFTRYFRSSDAYY